MKVYVGRVDGPMSWSVTMHEPYNDKILADLASRTAKLLPPAYDLECLSPDGFAWGYLGAGSAQLALALLADATDDDEQALRLYQYFMQAVIAGLQKDEPWVMCSNVVKRFALFMDKALQRQAAKAAEYVQQGYEH